MSNFFQKIFCSNIITYKKELDNCIVSNQKLVIENSQLKNELNKKTITNPNEEFWNNRKPKADIFYLGRTLPNNINQQVNLDVRQFIIINDSEIFNDLKQNNLLAEQNLDIPLNDLILKIYKHTRTKSINPYNYAYDDQQFKIGELWLFPFELRQYKQGDCDDWAIELASYLITAGIPYWRVRIVAGITWGDFGHLTVYIIGDDNKTWYHLNSTTPISMITQNRLEDMPRSNDEQDKIGIKDVWFSFNDKFSWHVFETCSSSSSFFKELNNIISIKPKGGGN